MCSCREPSLSRDIVQENEDPQNRGQMAQFKCCSNKGCGGLRYVSNRAKTDAERDSKKKSKRRFGKHW